jgi:nicotinamide-nucleotide amidase
MQAEIITIGDELLIGQVVDTNSAWIAQELNKIGIRVCQITSVSDDRAHIIHTLTAARERADIILMTGGLGPTRDDITKQTLCEYFGAGVRFDEVSYRNVEKLFTARNKTVTEVNRKQAEVLSNCQVLSNPQGTAPGMWFEEHGKVYVSMPGVPYEMKSIMQDEVLPRIKEKFRTPVIIHRTILTQGIGESFLSERIADWEDNLPSSMKLAYLPSPGLVRLRLSARGEEFGKLYEEVNSQVENLLSLISDYVYGFEENTLEEIVGRLLKQRNESLSIAESCTGGYISHLITSVAGSSAYYKGSIVAYSYEAKEKELGVSGETLEKFGAVSEQTVLEMVRGVRKKFNTEHAIACSGIAGPDGGTEDKPVGTVWIAVSSADKEIAQRLSLGTNRQRVIRETALYALNRLRKMLIS